MKKWVKVGSEVSGTSSNERLESTIPAYSRYGYDSEKQEQLTTQLREMSKAHHNASASNKTIRNSFYGTKD
jgi:hypothetical protein